MKQIFSFTGHPNKCECCDDGYMIDYYKKNLIEAESKINSLEHSRLTLRYLILFALS